MVKMIAAGTVTLVGLLNGAVAWAAPPTREEIVKVMDYLEAGQEGPVLLEATPCLKVDKKAGDTKKSCVEPVSGPVARKTTVNLWMRWFVPKGQKVTEDDLDVQFVHKGEVEEKKGFSLDTDQGSSNYAVYKAKGLSKAGEWELRVRYKGTAVETVKVTVSE